ncbi:MAG: hypothetical protein U0892_06115 [Pirellulales bacterium]
MTKLAIITPWPDERTGIADYAYDLVLGLADAGADVDVYTTSKDRPPSESASVFKLDRFDGRDGMTTLFTKWETIVTSMPT